MFRYRFKSGAIALFSLAAMAAPSAAGAAVILNSSDGQDCGSVGCLASGRYQQTFSAADLGGAVSIGALKLDRRILGALAGETFRLSFGLADGTEVGSWGSWTMGGIGGDVWTLDGTDFAWDPAAGDLVLRIEIVRRGPPGLGGGFGGGGGGGGLALGAPLDDGGFGGGFGGGAPQAARLFADAGPSAAILDSIDPLIAVPEASTWALMILGFGGAGSMLRRRRRLGFA